MQMVRAPGVDITVVQCLGSLLNLPYKLYLTRLPFRRTFVAVVVFSAPLIRRDGEFWKTKRCAAIITSTNSLINSFIHMHLTITKYPATLPFFPTATSWRLHQTASQAKVLLLSYRDMKIPTLPGHSKLPQS